MRTDAQLAARIRKLAPFWGNAAFALGATVSHHDYYKGRWRACVEVSDGKVKSKSCSNHSTALAWANYLRRHGHKLVFLRKESDHA